MTEGRDVRGDGRPGGWTAPTLSIGVHALALSLLLVWPVSFPDPPPETPPLLVTLVTLAEEEPADVPLAESSPPTPPAPEAPPAPPVVERAASPVPPPPPRRTTPKAKIPAVAAAPTSPATTGTESQASPPPAAPAPLAPPLAAEEPIVRPAPVNSPRPRYPRTARQRGLEGTVVVTVQVSEAGEVVDAAVRTSSGHAMLDQAAMDGVLRWRFSPARRLGEPTRATIDVPIRFELSAG